MTTPVDEFGDYAALDPFFRIIEEGLACFVDDRHFFDLLAEDVLTNFLKTELELGHSLRCRRRVPTNADLYLRLFQVLHYQMNMPQAAEI